MLDNTEGDSTPDFLNGNEPEVPATEDKPEGPEFKFKGRALTPEEIQKELVRLENLEGVIGDQGRRLGDKDKRIAELEALTAKKEPETQQAVEFSGDKFLDTLLENPEQALQSYAEKIRAETRAEFQKELASLKEDVSSTVNNQNRVTQFYSQYPEIQKYQKVKIGGQDLVSLASAELQDKARTDAVLAAQLQDTNTAFEMLAETTEAIAGRLNQKAEKVPSRDISERGSTSPHQRHTIGEKTDYGPKQMHDDMLKALKGLSSRIKPANTGT